jgi:hypothetical protein
MKNPPAARSETSLARRASKFLQAARDVFYGATVYDMVRDLRKERAHKEHLFILIVFGELVGIPILPPYYALRLLPYALEDLPGWKRTLLRERDITDLCDMET